MGYALGGVLFAQDFSGHTEGLLAAIGLAGQRADRQITLEEAADHNFLYTGIGRYGKGTLLINHFLPYDCSWEPGKTSALDRRLMNMAQGGRVFCFFVDDSTATYGFAVYAEGERVRRRSVLEGAVRVDEGTPLPEEQDAIRAESDDGARIFDLTSAWLGARLDDLIAEDGPALTVYRPEG